MSGLTGDTQIRVRRGNSTKYYPLKEVVSHLRGTGVEHVNGRIAHWKMDGDRTMSTTSIRSDGVSQLNEVMEGHLHGIDEVWQLTTTRGRKIKGSTAHKFMVQDGSFCRMGDLMEGDLVRVLDVEDAARALVRSMDNHPYASVVTTSDGLRKHVELDRLVMEADMNGLPVDAFVGKIVLGEAQFMDFIDPTKYQVVHRDQDDRNCELSNLDIQPVDNSKYRHRKLHRAYGEKVHRIEKVGEEVVYDLTMRHPLENYIANGFVVHSLACH